MEHDQLDYIEHDQLDHIEHVSTPCKIETNRIQNFNPRNHNSLALNTLKSHFSSNKNKHALTFFCHRTFQPKLDI